MYKANFTCPHCNGLTATVIMPIYSVITQHYEICSACNLQFTMMRLGRVSQTVSMANPVSKNCVDCQTEFKAYDYHQMHNKNLCDYCAWKGKLREHSTCNYQVNPVGDTVLNLISGVLRQPDHMQIELPVVNVYETKIFPLGFMHNREENILVYSDQMCWHSSIHDIVTDMLRAAGYTVEENIVKCQFCNIYVPKVEGIDNPLCYSCIHKEQYKTCVGCKNEFECYIWETGNTCDNCLQLTDQIGLAPSLSDGEFLGCTGLEPSLGGIHIHPNITMIAEMADQGIRQADQLINDIDRHIAEARTSIRATSDHVLEMIGMTHTACPECGSFNTASPTPNSLGSNIEMVCYNCDHYWVE